MVYWQIMLRTGDKSLGDDWKKAKPRPFMKVPPCGKKNDRQGTLQPVGKKSGPAPMEVNIERKVPGHKQHCCERVKPCERTKPPGRGSKGLAISPEKKNR